MIKVEKPKYFKDLNTYSELCNIVLNNKTTDPQIIPDFLFKKEVLNFVKEYLNEYDSEYSKDFEKLLEEHRIKFKKKKEDTFSSSKNKIYIKRRKNIDEAFALVHEFMHYIQRNNANGYIFSEVNSITSEKLMSTYLYDKYRMLDAKCQMRVYMHKSYEMVKDAKKELKLYNLFLKNKDIEAFELPADMLEYYTSKIYPEYDSIDGYGIYLIGNVLASYIHQCMLCNVLSLNDYKTIKKSIINCDYDTLKKVLYLDFSIEDGLYISKESIKILEKSYAEEIKYYESK